MNKSGNLGVLVEALNSRLSLVEQLIATHKSANRKALPLKAAKVLLYLSFPILIALAMDYGNMYAKGGDTGLNTFEFCFIIIVFFPVSLIFCAGTWFSDALDLKYGSNECEAFKIGLKTLLDRIEAGKKFVLLLRPFHPEIEARNKKFFRQGGKGPGSAGSRAARLRALDKVQPTMEQSVNFTLVDTPTFKLYNDSSEIDYHLFNIPGGENWMDLFELLAGRATFIVLLIEKGLNENIQAEISFLKQNDHGSKTLVVKESSSQDLPFEPRWEVDAPAPRYKADGVPYKIQLPPDFAAILKDMESVVPANEQAFS